VPENGGELVTRWHEELRELGFRAPSLPAGGRCLKDLKTLNGRAPAIGAINRDVAVELILLRLGAKRSAWNAADIRGEAEKVIASAGVVAERGVRTELAEDLTMRALSACRALRERSDVPEHVRNLTSDRVLAVEAELVDTIADRTLRPVVPAPRVRGTDRLDRAQQDVVSALAGEAALLVIEGAAGAGKTTTLAAARDALEAQDRRLVVVTPTLKAAQAARSEAGTDAYSAAWLVHQHGFRWDDDGNWSRVDARSEASARLLPGDVLLVDEAGMLDQDTALALFTVADEAHATVALLGDRHQLPAVGRGGVLDLAARWVRPEAHLELESVHRFSDPEYAHLSLQMRSGERPEEVFDALLERGQIVLHASEVERTAVLADIGAAGDELIIADTREQVGSINAAIRDRRHPTREPDGDPITSRGERIGLGDRVATRRNDRELGVANRDVWTVAGIGDDRSLVVTGRAGQRELPADYVRDHVELAFASTVHGAQGETVDSARLVVGEGTGAAAAYVGMTRGRHSNVAHLVAGSVDEARQQWMEVFNRDRADLGPGHAATRVDEDLERYGTQVPRPTSLQAAVLADRRRLENRQSVAAPTRGPGIGR